MSLTNPWVLFWAAMIFSSIAWYAILLFFVGFRGGREVLQMAAALKKAHQEQMEAEQNAES